MGLEIALRLRRFSSIRDAHRACMACSAGDRPILGPPPRTDLCRPYSLPPKAELLPNSQPRSEFHLAGGQRLSGLGPRRSLDDEARLTVPLSAHRDTFPLRAPTVFHLRVSTGLSPLRRRPPECIPRILPACPGHLVLLVDSRSVPVRGGSAASRSRRTFDGSLPDLGLAGSGPAPGRSPSAALAAP